MLNIKWSIARQNSITIFLRHPVFCELQACVIKLEIKKQIRYEIHFKQVSHLLQPSIFKFNLTS